jgi:hypothetical protein
MRMDLGIRCGTPLINQDLNSFKFSAWRHRIEIASLFIERRGIAKIMKVIGSAWSYNLRQRINEDSGYYAYANGTKETPGKSSVNSASVILLCFTSAISSDVDQTLQQNGRAFKSANSDSISDVQRLSKRINKKKSVA